MIRFVLALLALLQIPVAHAQNVPYFPQILPTGTVIGRLTTGPGPAEAIPKALWLAYLTTGAFTPGSVLYAGTGGLMSQDNSYLFWDATNHRLGLGTVSPSTTLHLVGAFTQTGNQTVTGNIALTGNITQTGNQVITGTQTTSGALQAASYTGTTTNDNAPAGGIGEVVTASVASGSAVSLTSTTAANVTSVSLTAGDWTVCGNVLFTLGGTTTSTVSQAAFSSTSATLPTAPAGGWSEWKNGGATWTGNIPSRDVTCHRASVASTTTYYLVVNNTFATSTTVAYGTIYARRER